MLLLKQKNAKQAQFCAGSNSLEIENTVSKLRSLGYRGVILAYAREAEITDSMSPESKPQEVKEWLEGTLKTIAYTNPGDYVAVKYSGAGSSSLPLLKEFRRCFDQPDLGVALIKICEAAKEKGIRLLVDAEQAVIQDGVHGWSLVCYPYEISWVVARRLRFHPNGVYFQARG